MRLHTLPQDILQEIAKHLTIQGIDRLCLVCKALHSMIVEDKYLWMMVLSRDINQKSLRLPLNVISIDNASAHVVRAWVKHATLVHKAFQNPTITGRIIITADAPARVTFAKLVRGRWCIVASSNMALSELSVWEITSSTSCIFRKRVYFRAPVLDGVVDDGRKYIRLAITVGTCRPSIHVLELARRADGEVLLGQCAEIKGAACVLSLKDTVLFFACLNGDDTSPIMMNWMNGSKAHLDHFKGGSYSDDPYPLPLDHCSGLHVWMSYIMVFTYSRLHVYLNSSSADTASKAPVASLMLPRPVYKVSFLDEHNEVGSGGRRVRYVRWVAHLADSEIVIFVLTCVEEKKLQSRFKIVMDTEIYDDESMPYSFATDDAVGHTGGYFAWLSMNSNDDEYHKSPTYVLAPIRGLNIPLKVRRYWDGIHLSIDDPIVTIAPKGLPFSRSVSCLDFDDGHGILLIGSDAGQFCVVNFAGALLLNEAFYGGLPLGGYTDVESASEVHLHLDIPAFYSYRSLPEYVNRQQPSFLIEDAVRLWGNAFGNHPPIPGWSNDWSKFIYVKDWIPPQSLWSTHDTFFIARERTTVYRVRDRLHLHGEIVPILYNVENHARVILRTGNRVLYCKTTIYDDEFEEDSPQADILGVLSLTYSDFITADSDIILARINDFDAQRNLDHRFPPLVISRKEYSAGLIAFALSEANSIGRVDDEKTLVEWSEDEWEAMDRKFMKIYYGH